ncbi:MULTISPECIES: condensation domain-containing protein [unclassified Kitasatospora]
MRDYEDFMPLAVIQEHFWTADATAAEQAPLTECVALALPGHLDPTALRTAVRALLTRHEILRSAIRLHDGAPAQTVLPVPEELPLTETALTGAGADAERDRALTRFAATGIDPATGSAIAFLHLRGPGPDGHDTLALAVHHIYADATAVRLLIAELAADYTAALTGTPSPVADPDLQYGDFVHWEHDTLLPATQHTDTAWWQQTLQHAPTSLDLRPDHPRRRHRRGRGRRTETLLPGIDGPTLRHAARTLHCSPYALCLTAWAALITRSTGHDDLILGVLAANRGIPQLETLVGQFANTVPLRLDLSGAPDLSGATTRCSAAVAAALEHVRLPFNRILQAAAAPRPTDRPPLIQHMFMPRADAVGRPTFGGQPAHALDVTRDRGRFDTVAEVELDGEHVRFWLEYDSDLYTPDGARALTEDYARILRQWLDRPELRLPDLELGTPAAQTPATGTPGEGPRLDLPDGTLLTLTLDHTRGPEHWPLLTALAGARAEDLHLEPGRSPHHPAALLLAGTPTGLTARRDTRGRLEIVAGLPDAEPPLAEGRPDPGRPSTPGPAGPDRLLALVLELWSQALGNPELTAEDDFFASGGHSLLATGLTADLEETLGIRVRVRTLFEYPTPAELTAHLRAANPELDAILDLVADLPDDTSGNDTDDASASGTVHGPASRPDTPVDVPLLSGQRQLWLAEQADPGALTHTIPLILDLTGPLDPQALATALNDVIAHQPGLRGTFIETDDGPVQRIHPHTDLDIPLLDLSPLDDTTRDTELRRLEDDLAYTGFDITRAPLLRARVIRLTRHHHQAQLLFHHLVTDEVSTTLLLRDLATAYQARSTGTTPRLPAHETDFATLARAEQDLLDGPEGDRLRRFWTRELAGAPTLRLPTDHSRPDKQAFRGEFLERPPSAPAATTLRDLATACRTTPFTVYCTAVATLLHRLSGQHDLVIGIPTANRTQRGAEHLIGCFLNVVPLRLDLSGNPRFDELVHRVSAAVLRAYEHQQAPFADIVQTLQPRRTPGIHPIYQVTCELQLESWIPDRFADLHCTYRFLTHGTARYDMAFHGLLRPTGLSAMLELNTDLWDRPTGYHHIDRLLHLLAAAARSPHTPVADLPV